MAENKIVPRHIGFIMDGNGRWAKQRNKERVFGHKKGADNVVKVVEAAIRYGIEYVSIFAFSCENWSRPKEEVDAIMDLLAKFLNKYSKEFKNKDIRVIVTGRKDKLSETLLKRIKTLEEETKDKRGITVNIAIDYGGKQEICDAVNKIIASGEKSIDEKSIMKYMYADLPDLDFIVRTSDEKRLSNFMLYQAAYAELYFAKVYWPDFDDEQFDAAIEEYRSRSRRFGGTGCSNLH